MSGPAEWVYKVWLPLPFGYAVLRLQDKFSHLNYVKWVFWRKQKLGVGHFREYYIRPKNVYVGPKPK